MNDGQSGINGQPGIGNSTGFSSFSNVGTGDIYLTPQKKSKKGLVIILIFLFLIIVGGGIAAVLLLRNQGKSEEATLNTRETFNKFANYVFYGEERDGEFIPYDGWSRVSSLRNAVGNIDEEYKAVFFEKADELLSKFEKNIKASKPEELKSGDDEYLYWSVAESLENNFNDLEEFVFIEELSDKDIFTVLTQITKEEAIEDIMDSYSGIENESFLNVVRNYYLNFLNVVELYKNNNCYDDEMVLNDVCAITVSGQNSEVFDDYRLANDFYRDEIDANTDIILDACIKINKVMNTEENNG